MSEYDHRHEMYIACDGTCGSPYEHGSHLRCGECGEALWKCPHGAAQLARGQAQPDPSHWHNPPGSHCSNCPPCDEHYIPRGRASGLPTPGA